MVTWDDVKVASGGNNKNIERLTLSNKVSIRLIGEVLPRYVYWVVTKEGKKAPVECLRFNRETQTFNDSLPDPLKELPDGVYSEAPQFAYVCNVIDRADKKIKLFDLKKTIFNQITTIAKEYGNPADDATGYDISITKEKTGPLTQNVKYSVLPARNSSPLTDEEKALELYDLNRILKRATYEEQKEWLIKNTTYFLDSSSDDFTPGETAEDL